LIHFSINQFTTAMKIDRLVAFTLLTFSAFSHSAIAQTSERQDMCVQVVQMGTEAYNAGQMDVTKQAIEVYYQLGCDKLSGFESVNTDIQSVKDELGVNVPVATETTSGSGNCDAQCQREVEKTNQIYNDAIDNAMSRPNLNRCDGYSSTQDYYRCKDGVPGYSDF
jgi:hypothetical protein